jgi:hypothetical protein
MAIDPQRLKLKSDLLKLDKLGAYYRIDFDLARDLLDRRYGFTREQFNSGIDTLPADKLPILEAFLNSWTDLIREAKRQRQVEVGNTPKSAAPSKDPPLDPKSTREVRWLTDDEVQAVLARHNS